MLKELREINYALWMLLQDTQHVEHNCGDLEWCPVIGAKEAYKTLDTIIARLEDEEQIRKVISDLWERSDAAI